MARLEAIVAGTGVVPAYGRPLFDEDGPRKLGEQLAGHRIPMLLDHDVDQPIEVQVLSTDVRLGADGEWLLHATYEVPDEELAKFRGHMGMSIGFSSSALIAPKDVEPDSRLSVDPTHFTRAEVYLAKERLAAAGFSPAVSAFIQLSELPPPAVIFELFDQLPKELGWALIAGAIYEGLRIFLHRGEPTRFRIIRHVEENNATVVAEIETSSDRALRRSLDALKDLDEFSDGMFVRDVTHGAWRKAGSGKRRRRRRRSQGRRR